MYCFCNAERPLCSSEEAIFRGGHNGRFIMSVEGGKHPFSAMQYVQGNPEPRELFGHEKGWQNG